jgi:hypothetical protein
MNATMRGALAAALLLSGCAGAREVGAESEKLPPVGEITPLGKAPRPRRDYRPFLRAVMKGEKRLRGAMVLLNETRGSFDLAVKDLRRLKSYGANHVRLYFNPFTGLSGEERERYAKWFRGKDVHAKCPDWWKTTGEVLKKRWLPLFEELDLPVILMMHVPEESTKDPKGKFWTDAAARRRFAEYAVAKARFFRDEPAIIGYDLVNEPVPPGCRSERNGLYWWTWSAERAEKEVPGCGKALAELYNEIIAGVRKFDRERLLVLEPGPWGLPWAFPALLGVKDDPRLIFSCHHYTPHGLSHWGRKAWDKQDPALLGPIAKRPKYPDAGRKWDRKMIAGMFETVETFRREREKKTGRKCVVWIGEFGTWRWLDEKSQLNWYRDSLEVMEKRGYGWAYFVYDAGLSVWWNCMTQDGPEGDAVDFPKYLEARRKIDVDYFLERRKKLRPSFEVVVEYMRRNLK